MKLLICELVDFLDTHTDFVGTVFVFVYYAYV